MAIEIIIPFLGHTMTEANIIGWHKNVGDYIEAGEIVLEIETEKVNYGIESPAAGILKLILAEKGAVVPVGTVVAVIGEADEQIEIEKYRQTEKKIQESGVLSVSPEPARLEIPTPPNQIQPGRTLASPAAKKQARLKGVDISKVKGTGRSSRIRLADVEDYLKRYIQRQNAVTETPENAVAEVIPMTSMRQAISRRLTQSFHDVPHFNLSLEVDMVEVKRLAARLNDKDRAGSQRISLNDLFIKVVALVLRDHPFLNARLNGDQIEIMRDINIGLAVALNEGLIVPAIERADQKKIDRIAYERSDLVERARSGQLSLRELERGTFTISNLGAFGITYFTSILNPPQTGILSIGKIVDRPVFKNEELLARATVVLNLTIDHRVVDGAVGAKFLSDLKDGLEDPFLLW